MPSTRIETLFLDAGGVLVVPNWDRVSDTLARHGVVAPAEALRAAEPAVKFAIDQSIGVVPSSSDAKRSIDYFDGVLDSASVARSAGREAAVAEVRAYHQAHNLWEHVLADVMPSLARLAATGIKLAVASNANGTIERCLERLGLTPYFGTICDSHVEGVEKPDPKFFEILLERTKSRPETTMHVGDLYYVDVVGARRAGLHPMLLDRDGLYGDFDTAKVRSLDELADWLADLT